MKGTVSQLDCGVFMAGLMGYCWDRLFQIARGALCHRIANTFIQPTSRERGSMLSFINVAEPPPTNQGVKAQSSTQGL